MSSDYIKQIEAENEELRQRLSQAETDLHIGNIRTPKWKSVNGYLFYYGFRNRTDNMNEYSFSHHTTNLASVSKLVTGEWHVMTIHDYHTTKKVYEKKFKDFEEATKYVERIFSNDK